MSAPGFEPLEGLAPVRKKLTATLLSHRWERLDIEEALDSFASELADEIRKKRDAMREEMKDPRIGVTRADLDTLSYAANRIDPYAEGVIDGEEPTARVRGQGARSARPGTTCGATSGACASSADGRTGSGNNASRVRVARSPYSI